MKLITNANKKRLTFPALDFSIDGDEIKKVTDSYFNILINNYWMREVINDTSKKGRKKKLTIK